MEQTPLLALLPSMQRSQCVEGSAPLSQGCERQAKCHAYRNLSSLKTERTWHVQWGPFVTLRECTASWTPLACPESSSDVWNVTDPMTMNVSATTMTVVVCGGAGQGMGRRWNYSWR